MTPRRAASLAEPERPLLAIGAGGMHASRVDLTIRTTLGSCVAACLHDPASRIGGMNHFMLPDGASRDRSPASFGVHAMELLVNAMMKLGADRARIVAKLFGAADMLTVGGGICDVAARNARFALGYLAEEGIPIVAQKLGGRRALSVEFDTASGRARVWTVGRAASVARAETDHMARLAVGFARPEDAITMFDRSLGE